MAKAVDPPHWRLRRLLKPDEERSVLSVCGQISAEDGALLGRWAVFRRRRPLPLHRTWFPTIIVRVDLVDELITGEHQLRIHDVFTA